MSSIIITPDQDTLNYVYDHIGNLKKDVAEGIDTIRWTVYGKINSIVKGTSNTRITYDYDAAGNRTTKKVTSGDTAKTTFYVRDASGNVMGIYSQKDEGNLKWDEQHLYGSSRLGIWNWNDTIPSNPPNVIEGGINDSLMYGTRNYELTNHLGNVLVTISDKKIGHALNDTTIDYFTADVINANDYYPFGMLMPGRSYAAANSYRYGFNGKENDNEVKGEGNQSDFGSRIYDPRISRWLSVDPLQVKYAGWSPYNFALNNPVLNYDIDGRDVGVSIVRNPDGGGTITFSSTVYIDGVDAANHTRMANKAFEKFLAANPSMKSSDGKWDVKIQITYVNANVIKHQAAEKQEMSAENFQNIKNSTASEGRAHSGMPLPNIADADVITDVDPTGNNGKGLLVNSYPSSGRFAQLYSGDQGRTHLHEELHNWGLGDYYADVAYDTKATYNGKVVSSTLGSSATTGTSTSFVGFDNDIMAAGDGFNMAQAHIDDLVNVALKTSDFKKSDNFVMARKVDKNRPNGHTKASEVPQTKTRTFASGRVEV